MTKDQKTIWLIVLGIPTLIFTLAALLSSVCHQSHMREVYYQEYLPIRNEYVVVHPKGTDDLVEIFLEQPYKWRVCINGLNHCQEVIIK